MNTAFRFSFGTDFFPQLFALHDHLFISAPGDDKLEHNSTATAHFDWNERWKTVEGRSRWLAPEMEVKAMAHILRETGASRVLDLGCGVGRHSAFLASLGFSVFALDGSGSGITFARASTEASGHEVQFAVGLMTELPFKDNSFDYLLAWNVIYHGNREVVRRSMGEIRRVLRPGGFFQGTMLSKLNRHYRRGREIAPETFVIEDANDDKGHPHFYCDSSDLHALFAGFEFLHIADREHEAPQSYHWHFLARLV